MNIRCPSCNLTFRVDPERVPQDGVRARCSRCADVFSLERSGLVGATAVAEEAATAAGSFVAGAGATDAASAHVTTTPGLPPAEPRRPTPSVPPTGPAAIGSGIESEEPEASMPAASAAAMESETTPDARPTTNAQTTAGPAIRAGAAGGATGTGATRDASRTGATDDASRTGATDDASSAGATGGRATPVFGQQDPDTRAERIARALVSDMVVYNSDRRDKALEQGTLRQDFKEEILKSWEEYVEQVGQEMAKQSPHFRNALNQILAKGQAVF